MVLKEIHSHDPLNQVTIDMKIGLNEIKQKITQQPNQPIQKLYEQKELELTEKHKDNRSELFDILAKFQINR